ncbi:caspase family protein [Ideonella paludis]|uniref:caspase family protein n=1 Tax=Ideonella paludis TaxID=1233411 RepID=UPI00363CBEB6
MSPRLSPLLSTLALAALLATGPAVAQNTGRNFTVQPQAAGTATQQRVALVIGNNNYADAPLNNPLNDAKAIAKALEAAGFQVILKLNANHKDMMGAVREFGSRLRQGGSGLFYFAGHGMQIKGRNYLIPVGADIQREDEVAYQAMDAQAVLDKMESAGNGTNLMILDACRNNPFARSFRSATQGLAQMEAPVGTLVAFATAPGSVSSDGSGQHGLYTEHLLRLMRAPGMKVEDVFKQVRVAVRKESQGKQIPWESTSLEGDFYFLAPRQAEASAAAAAPAPSAQPEAVEQAFWDAVKDSSSPAELQAFLRRYPQSRFAALAQQRVLSLSMPAPTPTPAAQALRPAAQVPPAAAAIPLPEAGPRQSAQADAAVLASLASPPKGWTPRPQPTWLGRPLRPVKASAPALPAGHRIWPRPPSPRPPAKSAPPVA